MKTKTLAIILIATVEIACICILGKTVLNNVFNWGLERSFYPL